MKRKFLKIIIIISLVVILTIIIYTLNLKHANNGTYQKVYNKQNVQAKKITTNYPTNLMYTSLSYLYSININSKKVTTISGYLGTGKSADSVVKIGNNEYAISNESSTINICSSQKCSQENFVSSISGFYLNNQFYSFEGVGDLAFYNNTLYATDVLRGVIVKINISNFIANAIITGLNNPHGIYLYNNYLYVNLKNYTISSNACTLIKISLYNINDISCDGNFGGYADGVGGYKNRIYFARDYLNYSTNLYNAKVYTINLDNLSSRLVISVPNQYIDGVAFNSKQVFAVFRSANPDVLGKKYYTYEEGVYNVTNGKPVLVVPGVFDGVSF